MIAAYNRSQILKGLLLALTSLACYWVAWLFFRYGLAIVFHGFRLPSVFVPWLSLAALGVISWSGYLHWKSNQGFKTYLESALFHDFGEASAGAVMTDYYMRQITGPAYVLTQVFLGGPLLGLRAWKKFQQQLPNEAGLEQKLHHALSVLRHANKWQSMPDHPGMEREILMLGQLRKIDFSAHKGVPRFKAEASDGV